jgi:hypothetical protein
VLTKTTNMEQTNTYEFSRGLDTTKTEWKPKPIVRYSVPNPPTKKIVKQEPTEIEPVKDEPVRTSFILDEFDEDVLDEVPQAVKLSNKEMTEINAVTEPEPELFNTVDEYTEDDDE